MAVDPWDEALAGSQNEGRMRFSRLACPPCLDEERRLVRRMRAGDESAYDVFSSAYLPALHRFAARRLGYDRELAKEIVQATLCRVLGRLESWRGEAPLLTWLCACCLNQVAAHYRKLARRPSIMETPPGSGEDDPFEAVPDREAADPEEALLRMETAERVHVALERLPVAWARVIEWRYLEDLDVSEIARRLGSTYKSAESLLSRARRAFREAYDQLPGDTAGSGTVRPASERGNRR